MANANSPATTRRRGFEIARRLIEEIEVSESNESTGEWDLFEVADRIDRALAVDDLLRKHARDLKRAKR